MNYQLSRFLAPILLCLQTSGAADPKQNEMQTSGNPIFDGWYADPEVAIFQNEYWIYPTSSASYKEQLYFDAFSSPDLLRWRKHPKILDTNEIAWAKQAMWAPAAIEKNGKYYLFFAANDVQHPSSPYWDPKNTASHSGGIGVAVADSPSGPFRDLIGKPLISEFHHGAQPIDQYVFRDADGKHILFYGGWGHCNIGQLNDSFTGFIPWEDGQLFHEITPENYVEGPFLFYRKNKYYFMWSEGNWTDGSYQVAYAISDKATGPFSRIGVILTSDQTVATGAGHNSAFNVPRTDDWYTVYHRRPIPNASPHHRVTCIDKMEFNEDGTIRPIKMTFEGVHAKPINCEGKAN